MKTRPVLDIVKRLGQDPSVHRWVLDNLQPKLDDPDYSTWSEVTAARLAGELRLETAVPRLVALLHDEEPWLNFPAQESLAPLLDPGRLQRFQNEARAAASLQHPNTFPFTRWVVSGGFTITPCSSSTAARWPRSWANCSKMPPRTRTGRGLRGPA